MRRQRLPRMQLQHNRFPNNSVQPNFIFTANIFLYVAFVVAAAVGVVFVAATFRGKRDAKQTKLAHSCYFFLRIVYWIVGKCNHYTIHGIILSDVSFIYLSQFVCRCIRETVYQRYYDHILFVFDLVFFSLFVVATIAIRSIATA